MTRPPEHTHAPQAETRPTAPHDVPLPGAEYVRAMEMQTPPIAEVPRARPEDFELTPPRAHQPGQTTFRF